MLLCNVSLYYLFTCLVHTEHPPSPFSSTTMWIQVSHSHLSRNGMASPLFCLLPLKPDVVDQSMFFLPGFHLAFPHFHCPCFAPFFCQFSHHFHTELFTQHALSPPSTTSKTTKERLSFSQLNMHSCPAYHLSFLLRPSLVSTLILALLSSNFLYPLLLWGSFTLAVSSADFLSVLSMSHRFLYLPLLSFVHVHTQLASSPPLVPTCCVLFCTSWLSLLLYCLTSLLPPLPSYTPLSSPSFLHQWA